MLLQTTDLVARAHAQGLEVHVWTFRNEYQYLAWEFNQDPYQELEKFDNLGKTCLKHVTEEKPSLRSKIYSGGSKGGARDAPRVSKFFQFHAVFGNIWQNRMLAPPIGGWRPLLGGNPGSATDLWRPIPIFVSFMQFLGKFGRIIGWCCPSFWDRCPSTKFLIRPLAPSIVCETILPSPHQSCCGGILIGGSGRSRISQNGARQPIILQIFSGNERIWTEKGRGSLAPP